MPPKTALPPKKWTLPDTEREPRWCVARNGARSKTGAMTRVPAEQTMPIVGSEGETKNDAESSTGLWPGRGDSAAHESVSCMDRKMNSVEKSPCLAGEVVPNAGASTSLATVTGTVDPVGKGKKCSRRCLRQGVPAGWQLRRGGWVHESSDKRWWFHDPDAQSPQWPTRGSYGPWYWHLPAHRMPGGQGGYAGKGAFCARDDDDWPWHDWPWPLTDREFQ